MMVKVKDLLNNICGIYKISFSNGKIYIGQSIDIRRRMQEHNNPSTKNTPCDCAINKYGKIEEVEILEICEPKQLDSLEKYWIGHFNSNNREIGYNLTPGGSNSELRNEENLTAVFTNEQVLNIRKRRYLGERKKDVYLDYQGHSFGTFEKIWLGHGYPDIGQEYLIPTGSKTRQEYSSLANSGANNGRAKLTNEQVLEIRRLYEEEHLTIKAIHDLYPFVARSTISRAAHRQGFKNI